MAAPLVYDPTPHKYGATFGGLSLSDIEIDGDKDITNVDIIVEFRFERKGGALAKRCTNIGNVSDGITKTDALNGMAKLDSFKIEFAQGHGIYYYDVIFIKAGVVAYPTEGKWEILERVSHESPPAP